MFPQKILKLGALKSHFQCSERTNFKNLTSCRSSRFYFIFCAVFEIVLDITFSYKYTDSNPLGIARGQSHSNFMLFLIVGNIADWSCHIMGS